MNKTAYINYKLWLEGNGYAEEIKTVTSFLNNPCANEEEFAWQAIFVICNSGMKAQIAQQIFDNIRFAVHNSIPISTMFKHKGKVEAIEFIIENKQRLFEGYLNSTDKISYLETIPFVGSITKYHLARNLGFDVCKPDRHLVRIASKFNTTPEKLCEKLSQETGDRIGIVDVILWRCANLGII